MSITTEKQISDYGNFYFLAKLEEEDYTITATGRTVKEAQKAAFEMRKRSSFLFA